MIYTSIQDCISELRKQFDVVDEIHCNYTNTQSAKLDLYPRLHKARKDAFADRQRLIFVLEQDIYDGNTPVGGILQSLQVAIQDIDISNYFVCLITTNPNIEQEHLYVQKNISWDPVPINVYRCHGKFDALDVFYKPSDGKAQSFKNLVGVIDNLTSRQKDLLFLDDVFCMMPWIGINIEPDNRVRPCCEFKDAAIGDSVGDPSKNSLKEIWNSDRMKKIRKSMLDHVPVEGCRQCYHKESLKRDSLRNSINRDFAHRINVIDQTRSDGHLESMDIGYWDIRYNNLCNFACRSCNPESSSSWYQISNALYPGKKLQIPLKEAGGSQDSIFEQIADQLDQVEKIYFAGGEPMMIENFYRTLEMLDQKGRHDVHLLYNTNLSRLVLKDRSILDLWSKFSKVSVGASLDAMGDRAEYLRVGTVWEDIVQHRMSIIDKCPHVDFYVSATTGLINALHVPDFHRQWVEQGLIKIDDFNIQLLYSPAYMSVVNSPDILKQKIIEKYQSHLEWLKSRDPTGRATAGFRSIVSMCQQPGHYDPTKFWNEVDLLDQYHGTELLSTFPELSDVGLLR